MNAVTLKSKPVTAVLLFHDDSPPPPVLLVLARPFGFYRFSNLKPSKLNFTEKIKCVASTVCYLLASIYAIMR